MCSLRRLKLVELCRCVAAIGGLCVPTVGQEQGIFSVERKNQLIRNCSIRAGQYDFAVRVRGMDGEEPYCTWLLHQDPRGPDACCIYLVLTLVPTVCQHSPGHQACGCGR